jgi:hypothetical protein
MSKDDRYLIESPTIAMYEEHGKHVAEKVPAGSVIVVDGETINDNKLIPVRWAEKRVMMFTQDLRNRGRKLEEEIL